MRATGSSLDTGRSYTSHVLRKATSTCPVVSDASGRLELFLLSMVAGFGGRLLILGDFSAPEIGWVYETAAEGIFGHQLMVCARKWDGSTNYPNE